MKMCTRLRIYISLFAVSLLMACALPSLKQDTPPLSTTDGVNPTSIPASQQPSSPIDQVTSQPAPISPPRAGMPPWPDTWSGIHVFNDQLASWSMTDEQWQFAATRYAGTQKMTRPDADRLRSINPNLIILHYRLGISLGYRALSQGCQPDGEWIALIEGENWVQEWPDDGEVDEAWFYHWPEGSTNRVLNCDWGWYLADLDAASWRDFWHAEVLRQVKANDSDGIFMDSLSVPNYLGSDRYAPNLPDVDPAFESAWADRIQNWLHWLQSQPLGDYSLIPNVGSWINGRDATDYSAADGVMIEGFALEADASPYNLEDWQLQMERTLGLIRLEKIIITQTTVMGDQERMFTLGSYLLLKDHYTYINIEFDLEPEWWPEYDIPIRAPLEPAPSSIHVLYDPDHLLYRREYENGLVLVNPTSPWDGSAREITVDFDRTHFLAQTTGGGNISPQGIPAGTLSYQPVDRVVLPPYTAAVLLYQQP